MLNLELLNRHSAFRGLGSELFWFPTHSGTLFRHLTCIKMNKSILAVCGVALSAIAAQVHAQITFDSPAFITTGQLQSIYSGNASPIGITYAGDEFVGTGGYASSNLLYRTDLSGHNISTFGAVPGAGGELVLAASPNGSAYGSNDIFSGSQANGQIYQFGHNGGSATLFATIPNGTGVVRGISFDTTGRYGHNMIVTTNAGFVFEVGSGGQVTQLASLGTDTEGIGFTTQQFGTYVTGTLFTTSENSDLVNAISPTGTVTPVFSIGEAESISFVPADIASESNPVEGFYGVNYPDDVLFAPSEQFDQYAGDVIVTSEAGGQFNIWAISLDGSDHATITGIGTMVQPEDSIFVTQQTVDTHGSVPDGGNTAAMLLAGMSALGALAYRRKAALSL
jgi:hypothetical protein